MNRLASSTSPYLRQHAHNPVDWYPWGEEALTRARNEDKPIFLSIGYAACHWCHVMAHESFEDPEIASILNQHFINIKVDREERPDLDAIYMQATVAMTGSGGWPMSVFLTPDLRPFLAGTYFPPVRRYNLPSFKDVLFHVIHAWQSRREEIEQIARQIADYLQAQIVSDENPGPVTEHILETAVQHLLATYDWEHGGWGGAPKFPAPMTIEFLLRRACANSPQRESILKACCHALDWMARGGLYDIVGGGFARYSVDAFWHVPHFEKMLYDNAQLAQVYLHAYLITGQARYRQVCQATLDFLLREMTHPQGGFYSSLDADSEGKEGKFYVWTFEELHSVLGEEFDLFRLAYGLRPEGNWEGKIVLQRALDDATLATHFQTTPEAVHSRLVKCHARLYDARNQRVHPATDDKVLVMWNALALIAFAEASRYLNRRDYLEAAIRNAHFLLDNLYRADRLWRSWHNGLVSHNAYLEDYAALCLALLTLYQSDPDPYWYTWALKLADEIVRHFVDPAGGFFDTRHDHERLLIRPKGLQDNPTPSGNALAAMALLYLAAYGDRIEERDRVEAMLAAMSQTMLRYPTTFSFWLSTADFAIGPIYEVALLGNNEHPERQRMQRVLWQTYYPRMLMAIGDWPIPPGSPAFLQERSLVNGQPTAYVCHNQTCLLPVHTATDLERQLQALVYKGKAATHS